MDFDMMRRLAEAEEAGRRKKRGLGAQRLEKLTSR